MNEGNSAQGREATLSAVVDRAVAGEPSVIIRHGRKEAVFVSFEEWTRVSKAPSFADLLLAFPGEPSDIPERRRKTANERHFEPLDAPVINPLKKLPSDR
jgi:antitoxin Phd